MKASRPDGAADWHTDHLPISIFSNVVLQLSSFSPFSLLTSFLCLLTAARALRTFLRGSRFSECVSSDENWSDCCTADSANLPCTTISSTVCEPQIRPLTDRRKAGPSLPRRFCCYRYGRWRLMLGVRRRRLMTNGTSLLPRLALPPHYISGHESPASSLPRSIHPQHT